MIAWVRDLLRVLLALVMLSTVGSEPLLAATPPAKSPPAGAGLVGVSLLDLTARVPETWVSQQASSSTRLAQFQLPGKAGSDAAELVVFYFGQGQGGSAEANIGRWESQFSSATGKPIKASVQRFKVRGMPVTTAELTGSYARTLGMAPPGAAVPDQTLLAAILETPKGNLFFQLHGPKVIVAANRESFLSMVRGLKKP